MHHSLVLFFVLYCWYWFLCLNLGETYIEESVFAVEIILVGSHKCSYQDTIAECTINHLDSKTNQMSSIQGSTLQWPALGYIASEVLIWLGLLEVVKCQEHLIVSYAKNIDKCIMF